MLKKLIITIAAISFSVGALALPNGKAPAKPASQLAAAKKAKEDEKRKAIEAAGGKVESKETTGADVAARASLSQKIGLEESALALVENTDLKPKLKDLIEKSEINAEGKKDADVIFLKITVAKLLNAAKENESIRTPLEQFLNESFLLMKLAKSEGGESARIAIKVLRDRLDRGADIETAIDDALKAAGVPADRKEAFKKYCLGMKA